METYIQITRNHLFLIRVIESKSLKREEEFLWYLARISVLPIETPKSLASVQSKLDPLDP
jgi:hypothetical protein